MKYIHGSYATGVTTSDNNDAMKVIVILGELSGFSFNDVEMRKII